MVLPRWIFFAVAFWVIAFGILRLRIATRGEDEDPERPNLRKGGYYARSKRSHAIYGVVYLIMGSLCISMGFGYQLKFFSSCSGQESSTEGPRKKVKGGLPAQTLDPATSTTTPASTARGAGQQ